MKKWPVLFLVVVLLGNINCNNTKKITTSPPKEFMYGNTIVSTKYDKTVTNSEDIDKNQGVKISITTNTKKSSIISSEDTLIIDADLILDSTSNLDTIKFVSIDTSNVKLSVFLDSSNKRNVLMKIQKDNQDTIVQFQSMALNRKGNSNIKKTDSVVQKIINNSVKSSKKINTPEVKHTKRDNFKFFVEVAVSSIIFIVCIALAILYFHSTNTRIKK